MNDDALQVGKLLQRQAREVGLLRMAVEGRVDVCASIATQFIGSDLEGGSFRIEMALGALGMGEPGVKLRLWQARVAGHTRL